MKKVPKGGEKKTRKLTHAHAGKSFFFFKEILLKKRGEMACKKIVLNHEYMEREKKGRHDAFKKEEKNSSRKNIGNYMYNNNRTVMYVYTIINPSIENDKSKWKKIGKYFLLNRKTTKKYEREKKV